MTSMRILVYAYGGALAPDGHGFCLTVPCARNFPPKPGKAWRPALPPPCRLLGTQFTAGYKWISGPAVSQQDTYGQSSDHIDPYLSMHIHQPLPAFFFAGHMQIEADAGNLLAQGYVPVATSRGQVILVPSYRYFRGGLSFQF